MDGVRDPDSTLIASNAAMNLWAGLKGNVLYVATNDAGEGNDHFIFLSGESGPGALRAAPWAKAGQVATWRAFLADENNNDYEGWFDQGTASVQALTGANNGVLEGTINLVQAFGSMPRAVHLAVAAYPTNDATFLIPAAQVPPSLDANTTLNANEFARVDLCTLGPSIPATCCPADLDNGSATGTPDAGVDINDLLYFLSQFQSGTPAADLDNGTGSGTPDGGVDINDLLFFLAHFAAGC
jgi:hypothetical protein